MTLKTVLRGKIKRRQQCPQPGEAGPKPETCASGAPHLGVPSPGPRGRAPASGGMSSAYVIPVGWCGISFTETEGIGLQKGCLSWVTLIHARHKVSSGLWGTNSSPPAPCRAMCLVHVVVFTHSRSRHSGLSSLGDPRAVQ